MIKRIITQINSVNKYGVVAVLIATSLVAFKPAPVKTTDVTWTRTGTVLSPNGNAWIQSNLTGSCTSATRICKATFEAGYDPNANTYQDNFNNATSIVADAGFHTNP